MNNLYDTVIIGSGSAGSIIANRLSKDESRNILVIEAGNDYPTIDSLPENVFYGHGNLNTTASNDTDPSNWSYRAESTKGGPTIRIPRGKIIGGSSSINAQMEASMLLGRNINTDKARQLAFEGDLAGMQKEILKQAKFFKVKNRIKIILIKFNIPFSASAPNKVE